MEARPFGRCFGLLRITVPAMTRAPRPGGWTDEPSVRKPAVVPAKAGGVGSARARCRWQPAATGPWAGRIVATHSRVVPGLCRTGPRRSDADRAFVIRPRAAPRRSARTLPAGLTAPGRGDRRAPCARFAATWKPGSPNHSGWFGGANDTLRWVRCCLSGPALPRAASANIGIMRNCGKLAFRMSGKSGAAAVSVPSSGRKNAYFSSISAQSGRVHGPAADCLLIRRSAWVIHCRRFVHNRAAAQRLCKNPASPL